MSSTRRLRTLLEMQGYLGLCDHEIRGLAPWLRLAPAMCAGLALAATLLGSSSALWLLAGVAFFGAVLSIHPFDLPYHFLLSGQNGRPRLPRSGLPRRFACTVAEVWLTMTGMAFSTGLAIWGYTLGALFFVTAMIPVLTDFCLPSFVWTRVLGLPSHLRERAATTGR